MKEVDMDKSKLLGTLLLSRRVFQHLVQRNIFPLPELVFLCLLKDQNKYDQFHVLYCSCAVSVCLSLECVFMFVCPPLLHLCAGNAHLAHATTFGEKLIGARFFYVTSVQDRIHRCRL